MKKKLIEQRKIIATDLDRTLIPDGKAPLNKFAMKIFKDFVEKDKFYLVFVTGRNRELIEEGIKNYSLPRPDFCISSVGTIIYKYEKGRLIKLEDWQRNIKKSSKGFSAKKIKLALKGLPVTEQPKKNLNPFKESFYLKLNKNTEEIVEKVREKLSKKIPTAQVIYSIDHEKRVGLLDVIPKKATKLSALKFLTKKLKIKKENVLYSGDSGNDTLPLTSGFKSVLVKNASHDIREAVLQIAKEKKITKQVYPAKGNFKFNSKTFNGNYVSGILEGMKHFGFI